ncbi:hypothetical protein [Verrucosispora sp. NA02020]|uniref:hypothetical protein n=1 Tax=Verrucosispora sp. NA02020 TaxID=2742132 RepID=UPI0015905559|nr:hypothetical protein [Verrucosispora sp. NA02020]QKW12732.1 hypothetical protein HUT12_07895 [Verrucosispora sp. NA02020]
MRADRRRLDGYLRHVNEEMQTAKLASEVWLRSAPGHLVAENDRFVRSLVRGALARGDPGPDPLDPFLDDPAALREHYWQRVTRAKPTAVHFGAADHDELDAYFTVSAERSTSAATARARDTIAADSPAGHLFRSIDRLTGSGTSPAESCRQVLDLLSTHWRDLVAQCPAGPGGVRPEVGTVLAAFHEALVSGRLGRRPPQSVPDAPPPAESADARLTDAEARELARLYMLGRLCFSDGELRLAQRLARLPRLQYALLATHLRLVAESSATAARLAADWGTTRVLLPFTEAYVNRTGYRSPVIDLSPNPKLVTVLCHNVLPAVAGELVGRQADEHALDSGVLAAGVEAAIRRGVFSITVGLFHRADPPDTVRLSGFSRRVCPAATPFARHCQRWLPFYFDRWPGASPRPGQPPDATRSGSGSRSRSGVPGRSTAGRGSTEDRAAEPTACPAYPAC